MYEHHGDMTVIWYNPPSSLLPSLTVSHNETARAWLQGWPQCAERPKHHNYPDLGLAPHMPDWWCGDPSV